MRLAIVLLLLSISGLSTSLKFLAYYPTFARSHITFMASICDVLAEAGHNVTILAPASDSHYKTVGTKHPAIKVIRLPQSEAAKDFFDSGVHDSSISNQWKPEKSQEDYKTLIAISKTFTSQCKDILHEHRDVIESLRGENFDAAFAEPIDMCGPIIFEVLGIQRTALTLSFANVEGTFTWTGMPSFPSYVPGITSSSSDRMTFMERVTNTISLLTLIYGRPYLHIGYNKLIREELGQDFPELHTLLKGASLHFVNADPLVDFPKPTIHKVIEIGGISVSAGHNKLNETWSALLDLRPQTVLISFGTVSKAHLMPDEYKRTIRETIKNFPHVTFIWKYEKPEHGISKGVDNLVETTWLPQNDFLYDARLSLFITHGGQGSVTEATTAGVPLIVVPVMLDQKRNAQIIKRIGTGMIVEKESLYETNELESAIRTILNDSSYAKRSRFMGETIRNRPFSPSQVFTRNMEFLARYGPLRQLDHYGTHLNFFQYYLIDVFAFFGAIAFIFIATTFFIVRFCLRRVVNSTVFRQKVE